MIKNFIFLFILIFASCSSVIERVPSHSQNCSEIISRIWETTNNYTNKISIQEGSYGARLPGYETKMKKVFSYIPSVKKFSREYEIQNNRQPKNKEVFDYIIQSNKKVISELENLRTTYPTQKTVLDRVRRSIDYSNKQLNKIEDFKRDEQEFLSRTYNPTTRDDKDKLQPFKKEFYGSLGEIDIFMKLKGADALGIYFKDHVNELASDEIIHNKNLTRAVSLARDNLENISQEAYNNLKQRFPLIFDREGETLQEKVKRSIDWIKSKEIDIIANVGNQNYLIEVKNYSQVMNRSTLLDEHGRKSIFTQQKELIELITFLDLDYKPLIVFRKGITNDASQMLEEIGFEVLGK